MTTTKDKPLTLDLNDALRDGIETAKGGSSTSLEPANDSTSLDEETARMLTDEARRDAQSLWTKILELHDRGAHIALGYRSWEAYFEAEFGGSKSVAYRLVEAGRVLEVLRPTSSDTINERQARELVPLLGEPEKLVEAFEEGGVDGKRTAEKIREAVKAITGQPTKPASPRRRNLLRVAHLDDVAVLLADPILVGLDRLAIGLIEIKANDRTKALDRATQDEIRAHIAAERKAVRELREEADRREQNANDLETWEKRIRPAFTAKRRAAKKKTTGKTSRA